MNGTMRLVFDPKEIGEGVVDAAKKEIRSENRTDEPLLEDTVTALALRRIFETHEFFAGVREGVDEMKVLRFDGELFIVLCFRELFERIGILDPEWTNVHKVTSCTMKIQFRIPPGLPPRRIGFYQVSFGNEKHFGHLCYGRDDRYWLEIKERSFHNAKRLFEGVMNGTLSPIQTYDWSFEQVPSPR